MTGSEDRLATACRHALASAPPGSRVDYGKPPRALTRCPDTELRRRGYAFIGRWYRAEAEQIAKYLRDHDCLVVLKHGHRDMSNSEMTVWAKRRWIGTKEEGYGSRNEKR